MDNNRFSFHVGNRLKAVCRDGAIRSAVITGHADTWFSVPAAVQVTASGKRRTVAGFLSHNMHGVICFHAYQYRANADLIGWTNHRPWKAALARRLIAATAYGRGCPGYIWDTPACHAEGLARGCLYFQQGHRTGILNSVARRLLENKGPATVVDLAAYFKRFAALLDHMET